jgi:hypothetical protein
MSEVFRVELTEAEMEIIRDSLRYSKSAKEDYGRYPNADFKARQIAEIDSLFEKLGTS